MFGRKGPDKPKEFIPQHAPADNAHRARLEALQWKDADPVDLANALRDEARRLYAPCASTRFPSRHEFNKFAGMVMATCNLIDPPQDPPEGDARA